MLSSNPISSPCGELRDQSLNCILWTLGSLPETHFFDAGIDPLMGTSHFHMGGWVMESDYKSDGLIKSDRLIKSDGLITSDGLTMSD